jgi:hypothetical protein
MDVEQFLIGERPGQRVVARDASHRFESVVSVVLRCDWIVAQRVAPYPAAHQRRVADRFEQSGVFRGQLAKSSDRERGDAMTR